MTAAERIALASRELSLAAEASEVPKATRNRLRDLASEAEFIAGAVRLVAKDVGDAKT